MYKIKILYWFGLIEKETDSEKKAIEIYEDKVVDSNIWCSASVYYNGKDITELFVKKCRQKL